MSGTTGGTAPRMRAVPGGNLASLTQLKGIDQELRRDIAVVAAVLPFKVNNYVLDELIDWDSVPDDPIFRLTFPHRAMLPESVFREIARLMKEGKPDALRDAVRDARQALNPHPGDQLEANVPLLGDELVHGLQHKYDQTVLVFPSQGQTCHSYCSYCFRWAQFVGITELKQAVDDHDRVLQYLRRHQGVSDVVFTGGDPLIMSTDRLRQWIEPLLSPELEHIRNIRLGSKALSYWPYRFLTDPDADALLKLLEKVIRKNRHVTVMAHFSHPRELDTPAAEAAIRRITATGVVIRAQAPVIRHVNDDSAIWSQMWRKMVRFGVVPYYMFVERDTGAHRYFELPLHRALDIYRDAFASVSGIERTCRGPVMSASPGKVVLDGVVTIADEKAFVCKFLQARNPEWVGRPFFAKYDRQATWLHDLKPAFREPWFWQ